MKTSIIVFPGSNCDRDMKVAIQNCGGQVEMVWHSNNELPKSDLVIVPGGFSYGDYLRCGAIAAKSPIMREVVSHANAGGLTLGVCNGFQVLTEAGLLDGTLMRNRDLNFICKDLYLKVHNTDNSFTNEYRNKQVIKIPVAHHDGNFCASDDILKSIHDNNQIAFKYCDENGVVNDNINPNGSIGSIAGIFNKNKNILGMMPHPERAWEQATGGEDGKALFTAMLNSL